MSGPGTTIDWRPSSAPTEPLRGLRDDPGRILLLIAAVLLLAGAFLPWASGLDPVGKPATYSAQEGLAEGVIMLVLAMFTAVLGATRVLSEATSRTLQLMPLALAVVGFAMWLGADRQSIAAVSEWTLGGGSGSQTLIRIVTAIGLLLLPAAVVWLEFTRPAATKAATHGLRQEWRISRMSALEGVVAAIFGMALGAISGGATIAIIGPNGAIFAVFISLVGMAAGISAGFGLVRWIRGGEERAPVEVSRSEPKVAVSKVVRKRP